MSCFCAFGKISFQRGVSRGDKRGFDLSLITGRSCALLKCLATRNFPLWNFYKKFWVLSFVKNFAKKKKKNIFVLKIAKENDGDMYPAFIYLRFLANSSVFRDSLGTQFWPPGFVSFCPGKIKASKHVLQCEKSKKESERFFLWNF